MTRYWRWTAVLMALSAMAAWSMERMAWARLSSFGRLSGGSLIRVASRVEWWRFLADSAHTAEYAAPAAILGIAVAVRWAITGKVDHPKLSRSQWGGLALVLATVGLCVIGASAVAQLRSVPSIVPADHLDSLARFRDSVNACANDARDERLYQGGAHPLTACGLYHTGGARFYWRSTRHHAMGGIFSPEAYDAFMNDWRADSVRYCARPPRRTAGDTLTCAGFMAIRTW